MKRKIFHPRSIHSFLSSIGHFLSFPRLFLSSSRTRGPRVKHYILWFALVVLAVLLPIVYIMLVKPSASKAAWWDGNFKHRTAYSFTATSAVTSERKVKIDVDTATLITATKMQSDCDDVRFTDANGQLLDFFIDTNTADCNNASTDFYIKLKDIKTGGNLVYMYYGNANVLRSGPGGRKNDFFDEKNLGVGLKGYWKLDEPTANTCSNPTTADSCDSAANFDGTWNADAAYTASGKMNGAVTFDGTGDYIDAGDVQSLDAASAFTISAWTKRSASDSRASIGKSTAINAQNYVDLEVWSDGNVYFVVSNAGNSYGYVALAGTDWHYITMVYDGSQSGNANRLKAYVDGVQQTLSFSGTIPATTANHTGNMYIGRVDVGTSYYSQGQIDDVRVYGRALSSGDVSGIYNNGLRTDINTAVTTFLPSSGPTASSEETTPGPVAYWKFDEGQGQGVQDGTTHHNNGTLGATSSSASDDPTWIEEGRCVIGKCLQFDGSADYVDAGSSSSLNPTAGMTISVWFKVKSTTGLFEKWIVARDDQSSNRSYALGVENEGTAGITLQINGGNVVVGSSATSVVANKWYHLVASGSSSNGWKVYLNGNQVASTGWTAPNATSISTTIGKRSGSIGSSNTPFDGFIDDVKIYPYARSAAEVKVDYNAGAVVLGAADQKDYLSDGLVGYWKMDETSWNGTSGEMIDYSGNGNNGTSVNSTTTSTGKFGNGGNFVRASSQYLTLANGTNSQFGTGDFTISAWAKPLTGNMYHYIYDQSDGSSDGLVFRIGAPAVEVYINGGSGNAGISSVGAVNLGAWNHVVGVRRKGVISVYINGVYDSSVTETTPQNISTTAVPRIGSWFIDPAAHFFNGGMDELRLYNRALSGDEIRALYNWAPGPVGYWNFNEGNGQSANDISGNANTGTLGSGSGSDSFDPAWTTGKYGPGLKFTSTDYVNAGQASSLDGFAGAGSLSVWARMTTFTGSRGIVDHGTGGGGNTGPFYLWGNGAGYLFVIGTGSSQNAVGTSITSGDTSWHHIESTYDGAKVKMYKDGVLVSTLDQTITPVNNGTNDWLIGAMNSSGANAFVGDIDDVRMYNYARTPQQIIEDMNADHPTGTSPVGSQVLKYGLDEQTGTAARNSIVNAGIATGAISGATWKTKKDCKVNGCLDFDGTDDVLTVTNVTAIDLNNNLASGSAFTAWVYADSAGESSVGQIFQKGTTTYCRTDTLSSSRVDVECSLDLETTDATLNISSAIAVGTWNHIAVGYTDDSDDEISIYINGVLRGTSTNGVGRPAAESSNLLIGGTTTANFDGKIDEFNIYSSELTVDQVRVDMNDNASISFSVLGASESADLSDGPGEPPIAHWKLDEKNGQAIADTSGNGYAGTIGANSSVASDDPTWKSAGECKIGGCLLFDATGDTANISSVVAVTARVSASAWFKAGSGAGQRRIIRSGSHGYSLYINSDGFAGGTTDKVSFFIYDGGGGGFKRATSTTTVTDNKWHFVEGTFDGTNVKLYLDGNLEATTAYTGGMTNVGAVYIGNDEGGGSAYAFNGYIDDVKVHNYARTAAQVAYDYNRGAPIGWWKFDECQGSTANDASGNGNHGTITIGASGTQTSVGACPTASTAWGNGATGKYSASLNFDGTDDYAEIVNNSATYSFENNGFSVSSWIKAGTTQSGYPVIVEKRPNDTTGWMFFLWSNGKLTLQTSADNYVSTSASLWDNQWHHVVATHTGSSISLYVDGKLITTVADSSPGTISTSANIRIGHDAVSPTNTYFNGQIDDVRIFNYALGAAQVRKLMNEGSAVRYGANN